MHQLPDTVTATGTALASTPRGGQRRLLMCPPTHFDVTYRINPWMDPARPVDRQRAEAQWAELRATYLALGHQVETIPARAGLPDMVYAANSALVLDGTALLARFRHPQRQAEAPAYETWFRAHGLNVVRPTAVQEGEGDFAVAGDIILAGSGFRTDPAAHSQVAELFGRQVVSLELTDPRFYHLDTALCVLDSDQVMYYPEAFTPDSRAQLARLYPDAIQATRADAVAFGLNSASDGHHVVMPASAEALAERVAAAGYEPVAVDLSELLRGGGSVKCCTLELR